MAASKDRETFVYFAKLAEQAERYEGQRSTYRPYLPCLSCTGSMCCRGPWKSSWPELVGKEGAEAKAVIEKENLNVRAILLRLGDAETGDFCCNRVWVFVNGQNRVARVPMVG